MTRDPLFELHDSIARWVWSAVARDYGNNVFSDFDDRHCLSSSLWGPIDSKFRDIAADLTSAGRSIELSIKDNRK